MTNSWQFIGRVIDVQVRYTTKGRAVRTLILERTDTKSSGETVTHCACETWHESIPQLGDVILAYGTCRASLVKDRWYPSFSVDRWHRIDVPREDTPDQGDAGRDNAVRHGTDAQTAPETVAAGSRPPVAPPPMPPQQANGNDTGDIPFMSWLWRTVTA